MTGRMTLCSPDWHSKWKTLSCSLKVSEIDSKRHPQKEKGKKREREKEKKKKAVFQLKYFPRQRKLSLCVYSSLKSSKIVTPKSSQHTALDLVSKDTYMNETRLVAKCLIVYIFIYF